MKGLLLKDLLNLGRYPRTIGILVVFYVVFGIMVDDASFIGGMVILLFAMMTITSFSYDDVAKWDKYALSLPLSRADVVRSKYLLGLILSAGGAVVSFAAALILSIYKHALHMNELLLTTYCLFGVALLFLSILMPLIYKFGVEKSRLIMVAVFSIPAVFIILLQNFGLPKPSDEMFLGLLYLSPLLLAAIAFLSYCISLKVYTNKEL